MTGLRARSLGVLLLSWAFSGSALAQEQATAGTMEHSPGAASDRSTEPSGSAETSAKAAAGPGAARDGARWVPDDGNRTQWWRAEPGFEGLAYLQPVRLHLRLGGHVEGGFGGVQAEGDLLLLDGPRQIRLGTSLVASVSPLSEPTRRTGEAWAPALPIRSELASRVVLRPSWRSHLGAALSFIAPGTGQFIQEREQKLGFLFLGLGTFFASTAALAFVAPQGAQPMSQRRTLGGVLIGLTVGNSALAAVHAHQTGRVAVLVDSQGRRVREETQSR